jgi:hypothetical protein
LEVSKEHILFVDGRKQSVSSSSLVVGDKIMLGNGGFAQVNNIKTFVRQGAFAPFTYSGSIVVNGVVASNYVSLQDGSEFLVLGQFKTPLTMHWLSHLFQAPHRMMCRLNIAFYESKPSPKWESPTGLVDLSVLVSGRWNRMLWCLLLFWSPHRLLGWLLLLVKLSFLLLGAKIVDIKT